MYAFQLCAIVNILYCVITAWPEKSLSLSLPLSPSLCQRYTAVSRCACRGCMHWWPGSLLLRHCVQLQVKDAISMATPSPPLPFGCSSLLGRLTHTLVSLIVAHLFSSIAMASPLHAHTHTRTHTRGSTCHLTNDAEMIALLPSAAFLLLLSSAAAAAAAPCDERTELCMLYNAVSTSRVLSYAESEREGRRDDRLSRRFSFLSFLRFSFSLLSALSISVL